MSKASLIHWSAATWADTCRKGDSELCGHLRKSVSGQRSSQCKGPVATTCLVCARTTRKAVRLLCRAWASKRGRYKGQRERAKAKELFSEWQGGWWESSDTGVPWLSYSDMAPRPCIYLLVLSLSFHPVLGILSHFMMVFDLLSGDQFLSSHTQWLKHLIFESC